MEKNISNMEKIGEEKGQKMLSIKEKRYRNYSMIAAVITAVCAGLLFLFLRQHEARVEEYTYKTSQQKQDGYQFYIDSAQIEGSSLKLGGWILKEGVEQKIIERHIVLKSHYSKKKALQIPTEIVRRPDLTDTINDGKNYTYSGFYATVGVEELDLEKDDYTVFVLDLSDETEQLIEIAPSLKEEMQREKDIQKTGE